MSLEAEQNSMTSEKPQQAYANITIDFLSKLKHDSKLTNTRIRSDLFAVETRPFVYDVWKLQPPNFNPQAFEPNPSKRKEEVIKRLKEECKVMAQISKSAANAEERRKNNKRLQDLFVQLREIAVEQQRTKAGFSRPATERPSFRLRFRPCDTLKSKIEFTKHGTYKKEAYVPPQLHDYRQVNFLKK